MITGSQIPPGSAPQGFAFPYVPRFPLTVPHSSREDRKQDCMHFILSPKDPSVMTTILPCRKVVRIAAETKRR